MVRIVLVAGHLWSVYRAKVASLLGFERGTELPLPPWQL
jgi:hypothetical protein